ncbi:MAG: hypothetical protein LBJ11_06790 [Oscillospiraceae bacterium]|jgi:hypothetical protein|nr:hypothetical protein [Oscillospiraceae bacterium]
MFSRKKPSKLPPAESSPPVPPPRTSTGAPPDAATERAFQQELLALLNDHLLEAEELSRHPERLAELAQKTARLRATVQYARAALRLEELPPLGPPEPLELGAALNTVLNQLRREFLFAGVQLRRVRPDSPVPLAAPREALLFLLEELLTCALRCSPRGRCLHLGLTRMKRQLLLSLRTEGRRESAPPLLPVLGERSLPQEGDPAAAREDYGFSVVHTLAVRLGWQFRWETDAAGVRLFLEISL